MWNITLEAKEKFRKCNLMPIYESDEEWEMSLREAEEEGEDLIARLKEDLEEVKEELLEVLPDSLKPYVENGTLVQPDLPKYVRDEYLQWVNEANAEFEEILNAAYENTEQAIKYLPQSVQDVFAESLHDSMIEKIWREENTLHLYLNNEGGFSTKSLVHLIFHGIDAGEEIGTIETGQYFIYSELQKTNGGFAFRVLFDCPETEWTITAKSIDACYYYRPAAYTRLVEEEMLESTTLAEYLKIINPDFHYWLITPDAICPIKSLSKDLILENGNVEFNKDKMILSVNNQQFIYDLNENHPIRFIYTDTYEDPYSHMNEPLPFEQLEEAALGDSQELQARAWNTMIHHQNELGDLINQILMKINITDENEMMLSVCISHFYENGILTKETIEKYRSIIEE